MSFATTNVDCPSCGIAFQITPELDKRRRKDGQNFYCPNGHSMSYDGAEEKEKRRLREEVEAAEKARDRFIEIANDRYDQYSETVAALRACPLVCGWRSRKQIRTHDGQDAFERGVIRVRADVAKHLVDEHGAAPGSGPEALDELTELLAR